MPDRDLDKLRTTLLASGVAPKHVARIIAELTDHYEDLESEAMRRGLSREVASRRARERMGDTRVIGQQLLNKYELRCWWYRYPRLARIVMPAACRLQLRQ